MVPGGLGTVAFVVQAPGDDGSALIAKATSVLRVMDESGLERWPSVEEWRTLLPPWFTSACAPEMNTDEAKSWLARWEKLNDAERRAEEEGKPWALADWLYWMEPGRRGWWWWEHRQGAGLLVLVEVDEWPFPWGALGWLLRASGAKDVIPEE